MGGGGGGGRIGAVAAAVLQEGKRVPISSKSIKSKYLCCMMENLYAKVNNICMYECMHAYWYVYMHIQRFLFFLNVGAIACMTIPYTGLPSPHQALRLV